MDQRGTGGNALSIRRYRYNAQFHLFVFVYGPLAVGVLVGIGVFVGTVGIGPGRLYAALVIAGWGVFTLALNIAAFLMHRPIAVDDDGIWDSLMGFRLTYISWNEVTEIVRRRYRNSLGNFDRERYTCAGAGKVIRFDTNLKDLRHLLDDINAYAVKYNFELILSDAGLEARRRILSQQISRREKAKQLREGIRTRLIQL